MIASFSMVPVGKGEDMKDEVARVLELVDSSGLNYRAGAMQTTVEGKADDVMALITKCHRLMKSMAPRVITSIIIDDGPKAEGEIERNIQDVEKILGKKLKHE